MEDIGKKILERQELFHQEQSSDEDALYVVFSDNPNILSEYSEEEYFRFPSDTCKTVDRLYWNVLESDTSKILMTLTQRNFSTAHQLFTRLEKSTLSQRQPIKSWNFFVWIDCQYDHAIAISEYPVKWQTNASKRSRKIIFSKKYMTLRKHSIVSMYTQIYSIP